MIKENDFFRVVIKHGILVPISIISTFIAAIIAIIITQFFDEEYRFVAGAVFSIDCLVSSLDWKKIEILIPWHFPIYTGHLGN